MRPTKKDLENAVSMLTVLKFFPSGDIAAAVVMGILRGMVATKPQLDWLISTLVNQIGEWPGPAQMRALYCTQFPPADHIAGPACLLSGYTPADGEARYIAMEAKRGVDLLPPPSDRVQRLLAGEVEPPSSEDNELDAIVGKLAEAKRMPSTPRTRLAARRRVEDLLQ